VQTAPVEEPPSRVPAFDPVSKLSDELTLVAPLSPGKQRLAAVEHGQKPARSATVATSPKAEALRDPIEGIPSEAEIVARPVQQIRSEKPIKNIDTTGPTATAAPSAAIDKQMREVAPSEGAEISFRKGVVQIQEGRANKAELEFRDALKQDPLHAGALQALLNLLLASGRNNDAEQLLRTAVESDSHQPRLGMILARLEVERGEVPGAINTLVGVLPYVQSDSEFYAFLAALLQREGRHKEAIEYYRAALRTVPGNGVWTMGLGISLRASNQVAEAREAFTRASDSGQLSPELQQFVERQLRELSLQKKK
jgi:MSHA biogenesis protein MshN